MTDFSRFDARALDECEATCSAWSTVQANVVGYSMAFDVYYALRSQCSDFWGVMSGVPIIVDPRMKRGSATAYYDQKVWRKRMREQNRWDFVQESKRRTLRRNERLLFKNKIYK